jgi:NADH-quinone oxidoreductase subunit L
VPAVGFFSKDAVLGGILDMALHDASWQAWLLLVSGFATVVVTAAYSMRAWLLIFFGRSRGAEVGHEAPWTMRGPLVVLAGLSVVGGALVLAPGVVDPLGRSEGSLVHPVLALATTALVLLTLLITYGEWWRVEGVDTISRFGPARRLLFAELGFDPAYQAGFVRPTWRLADLVVATDRDVVEPYLRGAAGFARGLGWVLRWLQRGNVQVYVTAVVIGGLAIGTTAGWLG